LILVGLNPGLSLQGPALDFLKLAQGGMMLAFDLPDLMLRCQNFGCGGPGLGLSLGELNLSLPGLVF
jgi:hypothetical protein